MLQIMIKKIDYRLVYNRTNKKLKPPERALVQIELYLNLPGTTTVRKYISTNIKLRKDQWRDDKVVKHSNQVRLNVMLRDQLKELEDFEMSFYNQGKQVMLKDFDKFIRGEASTDFIEFIRTEVLLDTKLKPLTVANHLSLVEKLKDFKKIKTFDDLTYDKIREFDNYLRAEGAKQSTIHSYHKRMKVYINKAITREVFLEGKNPYKRFKTEVGSVEERKFLYPDDLKRLQKKKIKINRLSQVRDMFLFSCFTGIAYSDAEKLTEDDIYLIEGERWIKIYRTKTETKAAVPILPPVEKIIAKYKGIRPGRLLPLISNQKLNAYLKEIADLCDIDINLTSHVARHTFATTVTLMHGVPLEVVQKMLGHKAILTTQIYAKMLDQRVAEEMRKLKDKI